MTESNDTNITLTCAGVIGLSIGTFFALRYKTSKSHQWLVRTGLGIKHPQVIKNCVKFPFQNVQVVDMTPTSIRVIVNAMSIEKMDMIIPAVYTIGPKNDVESIRKYSTFLLEQNTSDIDVLKRGIIEGETRALTANMSIEDIFKGRSEFKSDITMNIAKQLDQYGLEIYNANIEELKDSPSSNYFSSLAQKKNAEAKNKALIDVAEQNKVGIVGETERKSEERKQVANFNAQAVLVENTKQEEMIISKTSVEKTRAEQYFIEQQAKIKTEQETELVKIKLQQDVETERQKLELNKKRATELISSQIKAETQIKETEGDVKSQQLTADVGLYKTRQLVEAERLTADLELYKNAKSSEGQKLQSDAELYRNQLQAQGILAKFDAQSQGTQKLINSFAGDTKGLLSFLMIERGLYEKIAETSADAIRGLQPKITIWTHDPQIANNTISNLGKSIIPMLDTIKDQTGYSLPDWMVKKDTKDTKDTMP